MPRRFTATENNKGTQIGRPKASSWTEDTARAPDVWLCPFLCPKQIKMGTILVSLGRKQEKATNPLKPASIAASSDWWHSVALLEKRLFCFS